MAEIAAGRKQYLDGFHIALRQLALDRRAREPRARARDLPRAAQERADRRAHDRAVLRPGEGHVPARPLHQGRVPELRRQGPVRRQLRGLRRRLRADRAEEPVLGADRRQARAAARASTTSSACRTRAASTTCRAGRRTASCSPRWRTRSREWFARDERRRDPPRRLGHQPRRALLRHRDPRRAGQVLLRLARRAGRLPGVAEEPVRQAAATTSTPTWPTRRCEQVHFIGKDIVTFHTLFWPAMLHFSGRKVPDNVYVHGFITVSGEKMSKSRGTGISPLRYLELGLERRVAALLHRRQAQRARRGHRLQPRRLRRARQRRPGRQVHQHRQPRRRLPDQALRRPAVGRRRRRGPRAARRACARTAPTVAAAVRRARVRQGGARDHAAGRPRERVRRPAQAVGAGQARGADAPRCTTCARVCIEAFRLLTIYLKPVLPALAAQVEAFLRVAAAGLRRRRSARSARHTHRRLPAPDAARRPRASSTRCSSRPPLAAGGRTGARRRGARAAQIGIDDFAKIDLRIAKIVDCRARRQAATSCCKLTLDVGEGRHAQRVLRHHSAPTSPKHLIGKLTVVVANLAPRKMKFGVSEGMVLAASHADEKAQPGPLRARAVARRRRRACGCADARHPPGLRRQRLGCRQRSAHRRTTSRASSNTVASCAFRNLRFELTADERRLLDAGVADGSAKNISLRGPNDDVRGAAAGPRRRAAAR